MVEVVVDEDGQIILQRVDMYHSVICILTNEQAEALMEQLQAALSSLG